MKKMTKFHIKYGLILAAATVAYIGMEFFIAGSLERPDLGGITSSFAIVVPVTVLFFAMYELKKINKGTLTLWRSVKSGFFISLIAGVITGITTSILVYYSPGLTANYFDYVVTSMREAGETQAAIDDALVNLTNLYTPPIQGFMFFIASLTGGTVIAGIIGFFKRTKTK